MFAPIQQGLASQMGGSGCRELDRKKRQLFGHYLSYQNRKVRFCLEPHEVVCTQFMYNSIPCMQTIFLDTISSEEYDPLLLTRGREKLKVRLYLHHGMHPHCTHTRVHQHCINIPPPPSTHIAHTPHSYTCTQITTGCLDDPLISQAMDYANEKRIVKGCEEGLSPGGTTPSPPLGREDTDCALWLAMQLVHIDSEARRKSR